MQDKPLLKINPVVTIAIILELIFIIIVVVSFNNLLAPEKTIPSISIDNYSEASKNVTVEGDLNETDPNSFGYAIYKAASLNTTSNLKNTGAKIREGSVRSLYIDEFDFRYLTFLVDLDDLRQTYRVIYRQGGENTPEGLIGVDDYNTMTFCPKEDELIYDDFNCHEAFERSNQDIIVRSLISYSYTKFNGFSVNPLLDKNRNYIESFEIVMDSDDKTEQQNAISTLKNFLDSIGVNPDRYTFSVSKDFSNAEEY